MLLKSKTINAEDLNIIVDNDTLNLTDYMTVLGINLDSKLNFNDQGGQSRYAPSQWNTSLHCNVVMLTPTPTPLAVRTPRLIPEQPFSNMCNKTGT